MYIYIHAYVHIHIHIHLHHHTPCMHVYITCIHILHWNYHRNLILRFFFAISPYWGGFSNGWQHHLRQQRLSFTETAVKLWRDQDWNKDLTVITKQRIRKIGGKLLWPALCEKKKVVMIAMCHAERCSFSGGCADLCAFPIERGCTWHTEARCKRFVS